MELNYATLWEAISDEIGDREAVVSGSRRLTWTEYETRAAKLASALAEAGLGPDSKLGLYLYNSAKNDAPPPRDAEAESLPMHMRSPPLSTTLPPRPPPIENT